MNSAIMRRLGVSRRQLFEAIERATLQGLPAEDYVFAEWRIARVGIDYHVEVHGFFYSVPFGLIRREVDVRVTERTIEVFAGGARVATHDRRYGGHAHGTDPAHMPSAHRRYASFTPERFRSWARSIVPHTERLIDAILGARRHPEQGFRTCVGVLQHMRGIERERVEAVAERALAIQALTYKSIVSILDHKLERARPPAEPEAASVIHLWRDNLDELALSSWLSRGIEESRQGAICQIFDDLSHGSRKCCRC